MIEALQRLPGIGPKTAQRLTFFLLKRPVGEVRELSEALLGVKERIVYCGSCFNVTDEDPCRICADPARDARVLCVVEEPNDLLAMERTGEYHGRYHVLLGALSPPRSPSRRRWRAAARSSERGPDQRAGGKAMIVRSRGSSFRRGSGPDRRSTSTAPPV